MFRSIFKPYGILWTVLNDITDVLALSLLWVLCSLPVITVGAATTALYDSAVHGIRYREEGLYRRFFRTFRAELLNSLLPTLLWLLILGFCCFVLHLLDLAAESSRQAAIMSGAYRFLMLFPLGTACWSAAILSRFTYGFRDLTKTAFQFTVFYLPSTAAIALVTWLAAWFTRDYLLPVAFAPAVTVLVWSLFTERIFKKYGGGIQQSPPEEE